MCTRHEKNYQLLTGKAVIIIFYILFIAGGLWQRLGFFQTIMKVMVSPLLIFLTIYLVSIFFYNLKRESNKKAFIFIIWSFFVVVISFIAEIIGTRSGYLFGHYLYGTVLSPRLFDVPIAIGFAWLSTLLSSYGFVKKFLPPKVPIYLSIPVFMVLFDFLMEPAAVKLGYWWWLDSKVPVFNYFCWFVFGCLFVMAGRVFELNKINIPPLVYHTLICQVIYFILVYI